MGEHASLADAHSHKLAFGRVMGELAQARRDLAVVVSDYGRRLGLERFRELCPEGYVQCGIAEQNQVEVASALANEGFATFAPTYATFITARVLDQVRVNLGIMGSPVVLVGVGCGCEAGPLGPSHMAIEDLGCMRQIPGMTVASPVDVEGFMDVLREQDGAALLPCDRLAGGHQLRCGHALLGTTCHEVHAQLGTGHHERVAHVVARIPHEGERATAQLAKALAHGEHARKHLGWVELVREAVPHGDAGICGQLLDRRLLEATILDAIKHAPQHPGRVGDGLLVTDLRSRGVKAHAAHAKVMGSDLEGAPRSCGRLLEDEGHVPALETAMELARSLHALEVSRKVEQVLYLRRGEVQQLEEAASREFHAHMIASHPVKRPPSLACR